MPTTSSRALVALFLLAILLPALAACDPNPIVPSTPTPGVTATELIYTAPDAIITLAAGRQGDAYAVTISGDVVKVSAQGEAQTLYTGLQSCSFSMPALAVLPNGDVVTNDCADTKDVLVRLDAAGNKTTLATLEESVRALVADVAGKLYVGTWTSEGNLSVNADPTTYLAGAGDLVGHVWALGEDGRLEKIYEGGLPIALGTSGESIYAALWGRQGPFSPEEKSYTICGPKNHFWIGLSDQVEVAQVAPTVQEWTSPGVLDGVSYVVPGEDSLLAFGQSADGACGIYQVQMGQEPRPLVLDKEELLEGLTGLDAGGSFLYLADSDGHLYQVDRDRMALGTAGEAAAQEPTAAALPSPVVPTSIPLPTEVPPTVAPTAVPALTQTPLPPPPTAAPALSVQATQEALIENVMVRHVAWSPDGETLVVGAQDLYFYDPHTAEEIYSIRLSWAEALAFSPDGTVLATASYDGVKFWEAGGWGEIRTLAGSQDTRSLAFSPDGTLLATGTGEVVKVWEVATGKEVRTTPLGGYGLVDAVVFSPDGKVLVGGGGGVIKFWDAASGAEVGSYEQNDTVSCMTFSPDGKYLAIAFVNSSAVRLLDVANTRQARTLTGHDVQVKSLSFSPDGKLLAAASGVQVKVWDLDSGTAVATLSGHSQQVEGLAFSPDGTMLATGASDLRLWKVEVGLAGTAPEPTTAPAVTAAPSLTPLPLSDRAITPGNAAQVTSAGLLETDWTHQLLFTPDGQYLVVGTYQVEIYDARTLEKVETIESVVWANSIALSLDGAMMATAAHDGVVLWEVGSWGQVRALPGSQDTRSVSFSADGRLLATATGSTVKLWDVNSGADLQTLPAGNVGVIAFSPNGQVLAVAVDNKIELWSTADWSTLATLEGHDNSITSLSFSVDGAMLASSSYDGTARIWDVATGRQKRALVGHTEQVDGVALSPDGRLAVTGSWDLTVRLWDVASGEELSSLTGHTGWIYCVAFAPDGATVVSGADDEAVRLWAVAQ